MKDSKGNVESWKDLSFNQITEQYLELTPHPHVYSKLSHLRPQVLGKAQPLMEPQMSHPRGVRAPPAADSIVPPATVVLTASKHYSARL